MIGRLRGIVAEQGLDGSLILDVAGVGYELFVPLGALGRSGAAMTPEGASAEPITLHVHTHVREDAFVLYGFPTGEDRRAFRALIAVNGVGPKLAIAILGALSAGELALAIAREDKPALKGISGVGKKTVERLFLDLKDKLDFVETGASRPASGGSAKAGAPPKAGEMVIGALMNMGYKRGEAERAVESLGEAAHDASVETLLRDALAALR